MIRLAVALTLALALLAVSGPAIETVRVAHADARIDGALDRIESAARSLLARNDAVRPARDGAERRLTLHLPRGTWGMAGLERFLLRPARVHTGTEVTWRVTGGTAHTRRLSVPIRPASGGFVRRDGGRLRIALSLVVRDGVRYVSLDRR